MCHKLHRLFYVHTRLYSISILLSSNQQAPQKGNPPCHISTIAELKSPTAILLLNGSFVWLFSKGDLLPSRSESQFLGEVSCVTPVFLLAVMLVVILDGGGQHRSINICHILHKSINLATYMRYSRTKIYYTYFTPKWQLCVAILQGCLPSLQDRVPIFLGGQLCHTCFSPVVMLVVILDGGKQHR